MLRSLPRRASERCRCACAIPRRSRPPARLARGDRGRRCRVRADAHPRRHAAPANVPPAPKGASPIALAQGARLAVQPVRHRAREPGQRRPGDRRRPEHLLADHRLRRGRARQVGRRALRRRRPRRRADRAGRRRPPTPGFDVQVWGADRCRRTRTRRAASRQARPRALGWTLLGHAARERPADGSRSSHARAGATTCCGSRASGPIRPAPDSAAIGEPARSSKRGLRARTQSR